MTPLRDLVETSRIVAEKPGRNAKIATLAAFFRRLAPAEIPIGVSYLSGETRQGRTGAAFTRDGRVMALDAKLNFDDNALYRHKDVVAMRDVNEETPLDVEASKYNLNYIKLDGNVGCMVNGAGLAMATMDIIKLAGGEPANFLDVGGGASPEQIENAFRILSSDPSVKAVFINVFGGILRVDRLAEGIIAAVKTLGLKLPVVLRAEGTNVEQGKKMLAESGLALVMANDMGEGAKKVVELARSSRP